MFSVLGEEFGNLVEYEYMIVCVLFCYDLFIMWVWWEEDGDRREWYVKIMFNFNEILFEICDF